MIGQDIQNELSYLRKTLRTTVDAKEFLGRKYAEAERQYRIALRKEILRLYHEDNVAWTACHDLSRGDETVAKLKFKRDIYMSDVECAQERINQIKTEIRLLESDKKTEWAMSGDHYS